MKPNVRRETTSNLNNILFLSQHWCRFLAQPISVCHYLSCHGNPPPKRIYFRKQPIGNNLWLSLSLSFPSPPLSPHPAGCLLFHTLPAPLSSRCLSSYSVPSSLSSPRSISTSYLSVPFCLICCHSLSIFSHRVSSFAAATRGNGASGSFTGLLSVLMAGSVCVWERSTVSVFLHAFKSLCVCVCAFACTGARVRNRLRQLFHYRLTDFSFHYYCSPSHRHQHKPQQSQRHTITHIG